jgi:hypothetical protein
MGGNLQKRGRELTKWQVGVVQFLTKREKENRLKREFVYFFHSIPVSNW